MGRHEVESWLSQPIEPEPHLQTDLFAKVVLAFMLGRSAELYLDTQRSAHLQRMRELTEPNERVPWSTRSSPITACFTSKPTFAGSTSLPLG